jgi:hypothetical protein
MCLRVVIRKKYENIFCVLKVNEKKKSDPEWDPDPNPNQLVRGRIRGSRYATKCNGSKTLVYCNEDIDATLASFECLLHGVFSPLWWPIKYLKGQ